MQSIINAGSYQDTSVASIKEQYVDLGNGLLGFRWHGIATVNSTPSAYLDIVTKGSATGSPSKGATTIYANSYITSLIAVMEGDVTLGAATGKLRLASAADGATTTLYAESAAASGGTLTAATFKQENITPVAIGGSDLIFRIYATDGGAADAANASTVSAASDTRIICTVSGVKFGDGVQPIDVVGELPKVFTDNVSSY